jgi:hypothetical protein
VKASQVNLQIFIFPGRLPKPPAPIVAPELKKRSGELVGVRLYLIFALGIALALGAVVERSFSTAPAAIAFQF